MSYAVYTVAELRRLLEAGGWTVLHALGSLERRGPSMLVNVTEDTVMHAAPCDVLAVRLR